jgi:hypothetical protein
LGQEIGVTTGINGFVAGDAIMTELKEDNRREAWKEMPG